MRKGLFILGATVETRKYPDSVVLRAPHKSVQHPFAPGMRYVRGGVRIAMFNTSPILLNSAHLIEKLDDVRVADSDSIMNLQHRRLFVSGEHDDLIDLVSMAASDDACHEFRRLVQCTITKQYVAIDRQHIHEYVHQVVIGSGMGMISSGAWSDMAFFKMPEEPFVLNPTYRDKYHTKH